jgi:hypothetical protein
VRRADGDQLLGFRRQRTLGENVLTERRKGVMSVRRELLAHRDEIRCRLWEDFLTRCGTPLLQRPQVTRPRPLCVARLVIAVPRACKALRVQAQA